MRLRARVFWLYPRPLAVGGRITARIGTAEAGGVVAAIENAVDPGLLASDRAEVIGPNHVGDIDIDLSRTLATDSHTDNRNTGRVVLEFEGRIAGGGSRRPPPQTRHTARARPAVRQLLRRPPARTRLPSN